GAGHGDALQLEHGASGRALPDDATNLVRAWSGALCDGCGGRLSVAEKICLAIVGLSRGAVGAGFGTAYFQKHQRRPALVYFWRNPISTLRTSEAGPHHRAGVVLREKPAADAHLEAWDHGAWLIYRAGARLNLCRAGSRHDHPVGERQRRHAADLGSSLALHRASGGRRPDRPWV